MATRLWVDGLLNLRAELANLPAAVVEAAKPIVRANAQGAHDEIYAAYPVRSGALRDHLRIDDVPVPAGHARTDVTNNWYTASWLEFGTDTRQDSLGASRGKMPAAHVFFPRARRWRARMDDELGVMLTRYGFTVAGYAGE